MCGIFGALTRLDDGVLELVGRRLAHRGPDAEGRYRTDEVSLLHRRLRVIDLSEAAAQPFASEDGLVQLVFNGEVYNHKELRRELEAAGHRFRSRSDTEAILRGYLEWGEKAIERLDGMFALGIWDGRSRKLVLARDRPGKKPLFFGRLPDGTFAFASTVAALHAARL